MKFYKKTYPAEVHLVIRSEKPLTEDQVAQVALKTEMEVNSISGLNLNATGNKVKAGLRLHLKV